MDKRISDIFKAMDKINPDGDFLSNNSLSSVTEWIDTGSMALNAIISGSLYKGVPSGRIIGLVGNSGTGKSLIINKIIANFLKKDPENFAVVWDSEGAQDEKIAAAVGADVNRFKVYPVNTVEATRNQIARFLDSIIENKLEGKFILAIDSLGNLAAEKELTDIDKDKSAADMGGRSKAIKSLMRTLTYKAAKAKTTILFTNHIYADPAAMYPSLIQNQSGGKGPVYLASVLIQLASRQEKSEDETGSDIIPIANKVNGVALSAMTVKNRFVPPFLKTELYLNFQKGLDQRKGLIQMAQDFGVIQSSGPSWILPGDNNRSIGYKKDWEKDDKLWNTVILPALENKLNQALGYSQESIDDEIETTDDSD